MTDRDANPDPRCANRQRASLTRRAGVLAFAWALGISVAALAANPPLPAPHIGEPIQVAGAPKPAGSHPPLVAAPAHGAVLKPGPLPALVPAKPRLTINSASAWLTGACDLLNSAAVKVRFSYTNHDAPLVRQPGNHIRIHVDEQPGGTGLSAWMRIANMTAGQTAHSSMLLGMGFPDMAKFRGQHHLTVYVDPRNGDTSKLDYIPPKPYPITLDVPADYCQLKRARPPTTLGPPHPQIHPLPGHTQPATARPAASSGQQPRIH